MSPHGPTKILVVDDSALYRQSIQNVLRDVQHVSVVGTAKNGIDAIRQVEVLDPDLLTLDVQMPDMDGIQVLTEIKRRRLRPKAIMVSSLTAEGAQVTTDALMGGAFDFVLKPSSKDSGENRRQLKEALDEKIKAFRETSLIPKRAPREAKLQRSVSSGDVLEPAPAPDAACKVVIIGTSTGGPAALKLVLPKLAKSLPVPVIVVQHMPAQYTRSLAMRLNEVCELEVSEAEDMARVAPGQAIIAAGGKQLKLERSAGDLVLRVNDDPPENGVRPSVDYLIRTSASLLSGNALAVIMTGMGRDGLAGCQTLKQMGSYVFAQSRDDCVVYGMPKAVVEAKLADRELPLGKIGPAIVRHVNRSRRAEK